MAACALAAAALLGLMLSLANAETVLFCVHNEDERSECRRLRVIPPLNEDCDTPDAPDDCFEFHCVVAKDCRVEVREGKADAMMASALGLWYLEQQYRDTPQAFAPVAAERRGIDLEQTRQEGLGFKAVAITTQSKCDQMAGAGGLTLKNSKGLRSCHGEYGDLAGWVAPVARMMRDKLTDKTDDVEIVTNFYSQSCAPSNNDVAVCTACSSYDEEEGDDYCDLDDKYAGPLGVLACLREDAADVGFVDHWTAWGSGQNGVGDQGNAALRNQGDFQVVCNDGCRDLDSAAEEDCSLATVPADMVIMRATDKRIKQVRTRLVRASNRPEFRTAFGTTSNLNGALFSHGTVRLEPVTMSANDYLGGLDEQLVRFSSSFEDSTDEPQPDTRSGSQTLKAEVQDHPSWAIGVSFMCALLLGLCIGMGVMIAVQRRRARADREWQQPEYLTKDVTGAPNEGMHVRNGDRSDSNGTASLMPLDVS